jgi:hypothetical protein
VVRVVYKVFVAGAIMLTACGMSEPPLLENRSGQSAMEARAESPSKRPAWLPQDIPLPQDLVIFETSRMKLPSDEHASYKLEGYSWQDLDAASVTAGLRKNLMASGYQHVGNDAAATPQLIQFSGNGLAPGTVTYMQVNSAGDHLVISLSIIPQG